MNIFEKIAFGEAARSVRLGCWSANEADRLRRIEAMAAMNPKGFRAPPKEPRLIRDGKTRGELKREARARANALVNENRPLKFMHSAARRRLQLKQKGKSDE